MIRLALLGCSGCTEAYRHAAARLTGGSFAAVIDKDKTLAQSMAAATGAPVVLDSLEDALASHGGAFDAVVVHTPLEERGAATCQTAEAGKHVFVEAPVAVSSTEVQRTLDVVQKKQLCGMLGGTLRSLAGYKTVLSHVAEEKLGAPGLLRVHRWSSAPEGDDVPERSVAEKIARDVDLALCIFTAKPTQVYAFGRGSQYLQIHFGFPEGAMAVLDFTTTLPAGQGYDSLHVIGSHGAAYADDHHNTHLLYRGGEPRARISSPDQLHIARELQEFVDAIAQKRSPAVSLAAGREAQQVIDAVLQSLDSGRVLHLQDGSYGAVAEK